MTRVPVDSSALRAIGYRAGTLEVQFTNGRVYRWRNVPRHKYRYLRTRAHLRCGMVLGIRPGWCAHGVCQLRAEA